MPADAFEELTGSPEYRETYGVHPTDTKIYNYWEQKSIPAYIKFDIEREKTIKNMSFADSGLEYLSGNDTYTFGSRAISKKEQYFHSEKILLQILGYGIILLILALSLTNIFQNISMAIRVRKREFAAYQSMGMAAGTLKRMLIAGNSLYGLAAIRWLLLLMCPCG